jgi:hypothetical protein
LDFDKKRSTEKNKAQWHCQKNGHRHNGNDFYHKILEFMKMHFAAAVAVENRVAGFFLKQCTKMMKNIPNYHNITK